MRATGPIGAALAALALVACAANEPVAPQGPNVTGSAAARSTVAAAGVLGNGIGTDLDERDRLPQCRRNLDAVRLTLHCSSTRS